MIEYEFNLRLSADEYLQYYEGAAQFIQVRSRCGKTLRFPADKMRQFVLSDGIHGKFVIRLTDNNKFISINRV